jgi:hydrogenase maturation protease
MVADRHETLIVGVGNLLLADEGLGVHVARALQSAGVALPSDVRVLEAGTALLDVLPELAHCDRVIVVDAVAAGGVPGTLYDLDLGAALREASERPERYSLHQEELLDALQMASRLNLLPQELRLIGAEPACCTAGTDLTPIVAAAAERIVEMLISMTVSTIASPSYPLPPASTSRTTGPRLSRAGTCRTTGRSGGSDRPGTTDA